MLKLNLIKNDLTTFNVIKIIIFNICYSFIPFFIGEIFTKLKQEGVSFIIQIIKEEGKLTKEELEAVKSVLDKRLNNLEINDSQLKTQGIDKLILKLPDVKDPSKAAKISKILGKTAQLEFRIQKEGTSKELKNLQSHRLTINNLLKI